MRNLEVGSAHHFLAPWQAEREPPAFGPEALLTHIASFRETTYIIEDRHTGHIGTSLQHHGRVLAARSLSADDRFAVRGILPPLFPEWLGDRSFNETHGVRFPYIAGAMAQGISSPALVIAMAEAGMLGIYGAAGLSLAQVEKDIVAIRRTLNGRSLPWGVNLIHSPQEPNLEQQSVQLFLRHDVHCVCASAFMRIERSVVHYACKGLRVDPAGNILRPHRLLAKVSRPELAERFMSPPPPALLRALVDDGLITPQEADLAARLPLAEDITVEADSGGHTDNRPLPAVLTAVLLQRDQLLARHAYRRPLRVGAAGGIGTPGAVAAAFAMGAAYVMTGSINQATRQAAQSELVKQLLTQQDVADVAMAPAGDMFEIGAEVQVAKRGFLFAQRGQQLRSLFKNYPGLQALPAPVQNKLQREIFHDSLANIWRQTRAYWRQRDPASAARAENDERHKMALVFRWYLGHGSQWARQGVSERQADFQVWCGPAMGAFNRWVKGSFLEPLPQRDVAQIACNLLEGAATVTRAQQLRSYGVPVPARAFDYRPRPLTS